MEVGGRAYFRVRDGTVSASPDGPWYEPRHVTTTAPLVDPGSPAVLESATLTSGSFLPGGVVEAVFGYTPWRFSLGAPEPEPPAPAAVRTGKPKPITSAAVAFAVPHMRVDRDPDFSDLFGDGATGEALRVESVRVGGVLVGGDGQGSLAVPAGVGFGERYAVAATGTGLGVLDSGELLAEFGDDGLRVEGLGAFASVSAGNVTVASDLVVQGNVALAAMATDSVSVSEVLPKGSGSGGLRLSAGDVTVASDLVVQGNVALGIGTDSPAAALHVVSDATQLLLETGPVAVDASGNVGVGTDAPTCALHVAGAMRVQEQAALLEVTQNDVHVGCALRVDGDLSVAGNTVTTDTIVVEDHTIELAPNGPADGGGIVLGGDKSLLWSSGEWSLAGGPLHAEEVVTTSMRATSAAVEGPLSFGGGTMGGSLVPSEDARFDIGAPDKQIRDIFVSEGSIYVGSDHVLQVHNQRLKMRERLRDVAPQAVREHLAAANLPVGHALQEMGKASVEDMSSADWLAYARTEMRDSITAADLFGEGDFSDAYRFDDEVQVTGNVSVQGDVQCASVDTQALSLSGVETLRLTSDGVRVTTSGALELPSGSEAERPSLPAHGSLRYNETVGQLEAYVAPPDKAASWGPVAGSGDAIGNGAATVAVTEDATFAFSVGDAPVLRAGLGFVTLPSQDRPLSVLDGMARYDGERPEVYSGAAWKGLVYQDEVANDGDTVYVIEETDASRVGSVEGDFHIYREANLAITIDPDSVDITGGQTFQYTTAASTSDARIKVGVRDQDASASLDAIRSLRLRRFGYDFDPGADVVGWLAQEVEQALPDCVSRGRWRRGARDIPDFRYLNYDRLLAHTTGAVQRLADRVEELERQVAALKAQ